MATRSKVAAAMVGAGAAAKEKQDLANAYKAEYRIDMSLESDVLGYCIPNDLLSHIFCEFLSLEDICRFDSAICNERRRILCLELMGSCVLSEIQLRTTQDFSSDMVSWLENRSLKIRHLKCNRITVDIASKIEGFGSFLHWLSIEDGIRDSRKSCNGNPMMRVIPTGIREACMIRLIGGCHKIADKCVIKIVEGCPHILSLLY